jgi:hypothetical protein
MDTSSTDHPTSAAGPARPSLRVTAAEGSGSASEAVPLQDRVVLMHRDDRPVGALVEGDGVQWVDCRPPRAGTLAIAALAVTGATAVGLRWAARPTTIRRITMGPGGWVSVRGAKPAVAPAARPWWARLLRAYRL